MWNKKIIISKHVRERFEQRRIKFTNNKPRSIESQIRQDIRPLNIRKQEKLSEDEYKLTTRQGKIYIVKHISNSRLLVKTVYKVDIRKEVFGYLDTKEIRA